mmetsp:Transcript_12633/g.27922  ORF Transcript_12633/g.27922 Transcript_12633/m.27922 type:complete len:88 (-) Transcript_12633:115-378(-)
MQKCLNLRVSNQTVQLKWMRLHKRIMLRWEERLVVTVDVAEEGAMGRYGEHKDSRWRRMKKQRVERRRERTDPRLLCRTLWRCIISV